MRKLVVTHRRHKGPCKICYLVEPSARQKALSLIWLLKKNSYNHFWYPTTPLCLYLLGSCPLSPTAQHTWLFALTVVCLPQGLCSGFSLNLKLSSPRYIFVLHPLFQAQVIVQILPSVCVSYGDYIK